MLILKGGGWCWCWQTIVENKHTERVVGGTGGGMQYATLENEHMCSFLRVVDLLYKLVNNIEIVKSNQCTLYYHMQSPRRQL